MMKPFSLMKCPRHFFSYRQTICLGYFIISYLLKLVKRFIHNIWSRSPDVAAAYNKGYQYGQGWAHTSELFTAHISHFFSFLFSIAEMAFGWVNESSLSLKWKSAQLPIQWTFLARQNLCALMCRHSFYYTVPFLKEDNVNHCCCSHILSTPRCACFHTFFACQFFGLML